VVVCVTEIAPEYGVEDVEHTLPSVGVIDRYPVVVCWESVDASRPRGTNEGVAAYIGRKAIIPVMKSPNPAAVAVNVAAAEPDKD
jgi:hypothetical protein